VFHVLVCVNVCILSTNNLASHQILETILTQVFLNSLHVCVVYVSFLRMCACVWNICMRGKRELMYENAHMYLGV